MVWRRLVSGAYVTIEPDPDGLLRSQDFPGLWLDPAALLRKDVARISEVVNLGLHSSDHREFIEALSKRRSGQ